MSKLVNFLRLPLATKVAVMRAWSLLWQARVGLSLRPYAAMRLWSERPLRAPSANVDVRSLMWSIEVMAPYVPKATCLVKALAGSRLLARHGHSAALKIGVARGEAGQLEAHAWLERGGTVVLGGLADLDRYVPLERRGGWV